jgi:hypothetical protein
MKLEDISAWADEVQEYWIHIINLSSYTNKTELIEIVTTNISNTTSAYGGYISGSSRLSMTNFLLPLFSYVSMKFSMILPDEAPPIPELILDEDVRNMYENWRYNLISDYDTLFDLHESESDPTIGEIDTTSEFDSQLDDITGGNTTDSARLLNFRDVIGPSIAERMIYQVNAKPLITPVPDFDAKAFQLNDMYLEEVLDTFNWTYVGLND